MTEKFHRISPPLEISQENTCAGVSFLIKLQVEFCEISKTPFFAEHLPWLLLNKLRNEKSFWVKTQGGATSIKNIELFKCFTEIRVLKKKPRLSY